jgi:hypothetical protein
VPVPSDFYDGVGRMLLHRYYRRMLIPFAVDIPLAIAIFASGHLLLLNWEVVGIAALIHINHLYSVDLAERQARRYAVALAAPPPAAVVLSLTPRRLRDYTHPIVEALLALVLALALALWMRQVRTAYKVPVLVLYIEIGLLLIKQMIVSWRSPMPRSQLAEHVALREQTRTYYLAVCDFHRVVFALMLVWLAVHPGTNQSAAFYVVFLSLGIVGQIVVELKRKQLVKVALRARPVALPDFLNQATLARWPLCYRPSAPMLVIKGARGYSINLANSLAMVSVAYLAGLIVLEGF